MRERERERMSEKGREGESERMREREREREREKERRTILSANIMCFLRPLEQGLTFTLPLDNMNAN